MNAAERPCLLHRVLALAAALLLLGGLFLSPLPLACMRRLRRFPLPKSCGWVIMPTPALI